jgi:hypothetical protein
MNTISIVILGLTTILISFVNIQQSERIEALEKLSTHQTVEK